MSTKALVVWLILAVALGIVAILLLWSGGGTGTPTDVVPVGGKVISFVPGEVERIDVQAAGGPRQHIERAPGSKTMLGADADWQLRIEAAPGSSGAMPAPWPVESAKLQTLLRKLLELRAEALPAKGMDLGRPTTVELHLSGNRVLTLALAERTLAGSGLVEVTVPPAAPVRALVSDQIHMVFTNPGPRAWREASPLGGIAPDASRVRIEGKGKPLVIGRVEGRWSVREPVQAPADPAAVQKLLANLARITVADFLDDGVDRSATGLDKPIGTITIEADRRSMVPGAADAKVTTDTVTLAIGNAADANVSKVYGAVNNARVVLLAAASVRDIGTDAASVIWPHPLREAPADIGTISIKLAHPIPATTAEKSLKRAAGRWVQIIAGNADVPLTSKEQKDVEALLLCLTGAGSTASTGGGAAPSNNEKERADLPRPTVTIDAPPSYRAIGTLDIGTLSGQPLATLELGVAEKDVVVIRSGAVYRAYAGGVPELLRAAASASQDAAEMPRTPEPPRVTP